MLAEARTSSADPGAGSAFFAGIGQVELTYDGHTGRLPLFFSAGSSLTALFPARLGVLRKLLGHPQLRAARVAPGVGLLAVMAVEYRASDVGVYDEVLVGIPLHPGGGPNVGATLALEAARGRIPVHVLRMPVTSERALATGRRFWNFPKFLAEIELSGTGGERVCTLAEASRPILTLRGPALAPQRSRLIRYQASTFMDGQPQSCEFRVHAKRMGLRAGRGVARVELGDAHPMTRELDAALLTRQALAWSVVADFEAILFGPERPPPAYLAQLAQGLGSVHLPELPARAPISEGGALA